MNGPRLSSTAPGFAGANLHLSLDPPSRYFMVTWKSLRIIETSVHLLSRVMRTIDFTAIFFRFELISIAAFSRSIITDARNIYLFLGSTKFFGIFEKKTTSSDFRQIPSQTFLEFLLGLSEVLASSISCPFEFNWGKCFLRDKLIILVWMP